MFTQCPECQIAFRVSAPLLKQAAGRIRCGTCGHAFNALEYLSEELPGGSDDNADVASLALADGEAANDSDSDNKALLEQLERLAGNEDFRVEDTGVEWRVLDGDIVEDPDSGVPEATREIDARSTVSQRYLGLSGDAISGDEERYDDNSPLPDDFADYIEPAYTPPVDKPRRRSVDNAKPATEEMRDLQRNLALSEPEEWDELLDEVGPGKPAPTNLSQESGGFPFEIEEEMAGIHSDLLRDANIAAASAELTGSAAQPDERQQAVPAPPEPAAAAGTADSGDEPGMPDIKEPQQTFSSSEDAAAEAEKERTMNEEIDQQLLLATNDRMLVERRFGNKVDVADNTMQVETIVLQGDSCGELADAEKPAVLDEDLLKIRDPDELIDTYMRQKDTGKSRRRKSDRSGGGTYFALAVLTVALLAQVVHTTRESLAHLRHVQSDDRADLSRTLAGPSRRTGMYVAGASRKPVAVPTTTVMCSPYCRESLITPTRRCPTRWCTSR